MKNGPTTCIRTVINFLFFFSTWVGKMLAVAHPSISKNETNLQTKKTVFASKCGTAVGELLSKIFQVRLDFEQYSRATIYFRSVLVVRRTDDFYEKH